MDKKAYITQVLEIIKSDWSLAEWLLILVNQGELSDEVLDALVQMLQSAIQETQNEWLKKKLTQAKEVFEHIKAAEAEAKVLDDADIAALEAKIAAI